MHATCYLPKLLPSASETLALLLMTRRAGGEVADGGMHSGGRIGWGRDASREQAGGGCRRGDKGGQG